LKNCGISFPSTKQQKQLHIGNHSNLDANNLYFPSSSGQSGGGYFSNNGELISIHSKLQDNFDNMRLNENKPLSKIEKISPAPDLIKYSPKEIPGFNEENLQEETDALNLLSDLKTHFLIKKLPSLRIPKFCTMDEKDITFTSHQMQHLGGKKGKTRFHHFLNSEDPLFQALAITIQKSIAHLVNCGHEKHYHPAISRINKKSMPIEIDPSATFYVDLGFTIGFCRKERSETSWVLVDNPLGGTYHFYPNGLPENGSSKPKSNDIWLDLKLFLEILKDSTR
jgi:hypothetical protein